MGKVPANPWARWHEGEQHLLVGALFRPTFPAQPLLDRPDFTVATPVALPELVAQLPDAVTLRAA
ncbi:hypothetical protein [Tessaracoccus caeni]|uniref:hypothetical protein n=1 Tax=Tessaracoccus caeni TaxID=3031239 RepID=UPI0023DA2144|nr:hypothetical protein [Tessaracoccus caeni]MDF1489903.1 hypothetical protein [Tessaracoccus caeni]